MATKNKLIIGRRDRVDLPELDLTDIDAKIDTGAYSCVIHCLNMKIIQRDGRPWVRFTLYDDEEKKHEAPIILYKSIKSSFGEVEHRCMIQTSLRLFENDYPIQLALSDRSTMKYPMLIGRRLLTDHFIVDVSKHNLSYKKKLKSKKK
ncbi:MAG: ATP-dependent zinc protease [Bacteroidota bacterium]|jgi:hypothetical protein|nr:RimK/LysX family protein [Bacteroidota bacterium]GDX47678.1 ribosomal protein S6 modification protein [Bacteroidota bacterium]